MTKSLIIAISRLIASWLGFALILTGSVKLPAAQSTVQVEEVVTSYTPADNGAGPLWCYGSPLVVRQNDAVSVSIIETGRDVPPLCNTRWQLWRRDRDGWRAVAAEADYRQREPCPLAGLAQRELFLSANPSTQPPGTQYGACEPAVIRLTDQGGIWTQAVEKPAWADGTHFTDHSYRGLAADAERGELLLLNIHAGSSAQYVSHRDAHGTWRARGTIEFPIRAAYPQVALRAGGAHVMAIGDIQEPVAAWRELKFRHLNRQWDYVFRRLFYTYTPDLAGEPFGEPVEVDTVEKTAGHIANLDLHVDADGAAHLLYIKRPHVYDFIRDKYFPGEPFLQRLEYVIVRGSKVASRRTLYATPSDDRGFEPSYARFHVDARHDLYVVAAGKNTSPGTNAEHENRIFPVQRPGEFVTLTLKHPFRTFFTNTTRGGSPPSDDLDLFGVADDGQNLRYAHVRLSAD